MAARVATIAFLAAFLVACSTRLPAGRARHFEDPGRPVPLRAPVRTLESASGEWLQHRSRLLAGGIAAPGEWPWRPQLEIGFATGFPMGEFGDRVDDPGLGLGLLAGIGLPNAPIVLGAEFCFLTYGRTSHTEIISTSIGDVEADVTTTNDIVMGHLLLRIQPRSGRVRPYLDGLFGFKNFSTDTRITVPDYDPDEPFGTATIASKTQLDDTALSYGAGAGLDIRLGHWTHEPGDTTAVRLNLGARYLFGARAKYLAKGGFRTQGDAVGLDVLHSRTDLLVAQVGLSLEF